MGPPDGSALIFQESLFFPPFRTPRSAFHGELFPAAAPTPRGDAATPLWFCDRSASRATNATPSGECARLPILVTPRGPPPKTGGTPAGSTFVLPALSPKRAEGCGDNSAPSRPPRKDRPRAQQQPAAAEQTCLEDLPVWLRDDGLAQLVCSQKAKLASGRRKNWKDIMARDRIRNARRRGESGRTSQEHSEVAATNAASERAEEQSNNDEPVVTFFAQERRTCRIVVKSELKSLGVRHHVLERTEKRGTFLSSIRLKHSARVRLRRITNHRRCHQRWQQERLTMQKDQVDLTEEQKHRVKEVFDHYDVDCSDTLDALELREALADLGYTPRSREEKRHFAEAVACIGSGTPEDEAQRRGELVYAAFETLVAELMKRCRDALQTEIKEQLMVHDLESLEQLDMKDVFLLLEQLNLAPRTTAEFAVVERIWLEALQPPAADLDPAQEAKDGGGGGGGRSDSKEVPGPRRPGQDGGGGGGGRSGSKEVPGPRRPGQDGGGGGGRSSSKEESGLLLAAAPPSEGGEPPFAAMASEGSAEGGCSISSLRASPVVAVRRPVMPDGVEAVAAAAGLAFGAAAAARKQRQQMDGDLDLEFVVSRIRERIGSLRRSRHHALVAEGALNQTLVTEFHDELCELKDRFDALLEDGRSTLRSEDLRVLMADHGMRPPTTYQQQHVQARIEYHASHNGGSFDFPAALELLFFARQVAKQSRLEELQDIFAASDKDGSGALSQQECGQMLGKMGLNPRTRAQQRQIATILEAVDVDGSGDYSLDEVEGLFQRVTEMLGKEKRKEELEMAEEIGISPHVVEQHHDIFATLDEDGTGVLQVKELRQLVDASRAQISAEVMSQMVRVVDENESGLVEFAEFLKFMSLLKAHTARQKAKRTASKSGRKPTGGDLLV